MPLSIISRTENDIAILELEGALTLGPSLHALRDAARHILSQGRPGGLIIQVNKVTTTDSAGLGELTVVYTFSSKQGCRVVLCGVSPSLRTMLEVTHLDGLLPSAADLASAKKLISSGATGSSGS
ncbi:MAG: STAS domain-containing protein [Acidobacteriota bacterium]|nr:STAS domain-containing protein [Acidobacteriota bacterium]